MNLIDEIELLVNTVIEKEYKELPKDVLTNKIRKDPYVDMRAFFAALLKKELKSRITLAAIAEKLGGQTHPNVYHSLTNHANLCQVNVIYRRQYLAFLAHVVRYGTNNPSLKEPLELLITKHSSVETFSELIKLPI